MQDSQELVLEHANKLKKILETIKIPLGDLETSCNALNTDERNEIREHILAVQKNLLYIYTNIKEFAENCVNFGTEPQKSDILITLHNNIVKKKAWICCYNKDEFREYLRVCYGLRNNNDLSIKDTVLELDYLRKENFNKQLMTNIDINEANTRTIINSFTEVINSFTKALEIAKTIRDILDPKSPHKNQHVDTQSNSSSNAQATICASFLMTVFNSEAFRSWKLQLLSAALTIVSALVITALLMNPTTLATAIPVIAAIVVKLSPLVFNLILGAAIAVAATATAVFTASLYKAGRLPFFETQSAHGRMQLALPQNDVADSLGGISLSNID